MMDHASRVSVGWQKTSDWELGVYKRGLVRTALRSLQYHRCPPMISAKTLVHPAWATLHLPHGAEMIGADKIQILVELLQSESKITAEFDPDFDPIFQLSLDRQSKRASIKRDKQILYKFDRSFNAEDRVSLLANALQIVGDVWPEQRDFLQKAISRVVYFKAPREWSYSDTLTGGAVYFNAAFGREPLDLAECLIHEAGHHALHIKQLLLPLLKNPDVLCSSPLRPDLRPLTGLLHAAFVLRRLIEFYERVERCSLEIGPAQRLRLNQYRLDLVQALETLERKSEFTTYGKTLFKSLA